MAKHPSFPFFTDAYLADTQHLTTIEHGAYLLLLISMWRNQPDISLPDNETLLARYTKLTRGQWRRIEPTIRPLFHVENGVWRQRRLTDEYEAVRQLSKRQSNKAKRRWLNYKETDYAGAEPGQCPSDASHTHTHTIGTNVPIDNAPQAKENNETKQVKHEYTESFERFWNRYGKNGASKFAAFKSWNGAIKHAEPDTIIAAVEPYLEYCTRTDTPKCHATTWLNQQRWTVDHASLAGKGASRPGGVSGTRESAHDTMGRAWASAAGRNPDDS